MLLYQMMHGMLGNITMDYEAIRTCRKLPQIHLVIDYNEELKCFARLYHLLTAANRDLLLSSSTIVFPPKNLKCGYKEKKEIQGEQC